MDDGVSHVAFVPADEIDEFNVDEWVDMRYEGLQLLGVVKVVLHAEPYQFVRRIDAR
jgi:hypothetical protein